MRDIDPEIIRDRFRHVNGNNQLEPGIYAIVHSLIEEASDCRHDILLQKGKLHMTKAKEPVYTEVNVESIAAPAFVVPDLGGEKEDVFVLKPIDEWASFSTKKTITKQKLSKQYPLHS